jgi:hypothetical protein
MTENQISADCRFIADINIFRVLNQTFNELKLEKHPDKTLIGR